MAFYALDTVMHQGREYPRGEKLPVEKEQGERLVELNVASTSKPKVEDGEPEATDDSTSDESTADDASQA